MKKPTDIFHVVNNLMKHHEPDKKKMMHRFTPFCLQQLDKVNPNPNKSKTNLHFFQ